jgi:hypothetical protein
MTALSIEYVSREECQGHHLDLYLARDPKKLRYCDDCGGRLREEIRKAMKEEINGD